MQNVTKNTKKKILRQHTPSNIANLKVSPQKRVK